MAEEERVDGAAEEQIEAKDAESKEDSQAQGMTEKQVEKLLQERDKKWQSKFDKLLQEKKETESKSKTAEERIAEIEHKYEQERLGRVRERAISGAGLDPSLVEAAQGLVGNDEEAISSGASKLSKLIESEVEKRTTERLEAEINKRFPKDKEKPQSGKVSGDLTYEDLQEMSEEQIAALPQDTFNKIMGN